MIFKTLAIGVMSGAIAAVVFAMCGNGGRAPGPSKPTPAVKGDVADDPAGTKKPVERSGTTISDTAQSQAVNDSEKIYDFAKNLSGAHLRSGGLLVDFGTPARHKYTLGDWKTGWRGDYDEGGTTFSYLSGATGRIYFDASKSEVGGGTVTVRARAVGSTSGRVYLNGKQIGTMKLDSKDDFGHSAIEFATGIKKGRNELMLRFNTRRPAHDGKGAALAVDYIRITPVDSGSGPSASSFDAVIYPDRTGKEPGILLGRGESVTYNIPVPKGAVIRGKVRSHLVDGTAKLSVTARGDDGEEIPLANLEAGKRSTSMVVSLAGHAGKVVAITFEATAGEVVISGAGLYSAKRKADTAPGAMTAKNVMIVLIDTLRADHLALYNNNTRVQTAFMNKIGAESMVFNRALVQENWTKPSVATLLTGLFPETHRTKTEKNKIPRTVKLISEHFRELGFTTAAFIANGYVSGKFGFEKGWDTWRNYVREGKANRAQFVARDTIAWLESRPRDKPFLLYVHTIDPHVPYIPPKEFRALYDDEPYNGVVTPRGTAKLLEGIKKGSVKLSQRDKYRLEALYDGEISYHDDHFARIYQAMADQGLLENTLIVVTSDHGEEFFEHGSVGHGHSMYEEMLHVPLLMRLPGASGHEGKARSDAEVGLVDVFPTVCELTGVEAPGDVEGRSLVPLLNGVAGDRWPGVSFSDFLYGQRAVRMGRYKLIYRGLSTTLFDLETDPAETTDLSDEMPITLAALHEQLGIHQGRFVDTGSVGGADDVPKTVDRARAPASKKKHKKEDTVIDPETRKQLEALGYIGD